VHEAALEANAPACRIDCNAILPGGSISMATKSAKGRDPARTGKRTRSRAGTRNARAVWERGYFSHSYWKRGQKLGTVKLGPKNEWDGVYRWTAGHHFGETNNLASAKRAVEQAVDFGATQMGLFDS